MRIFIHHVDTYVGEAILKELRKTDAKYNRIFATLKDDTKEKPNIVKRVVSLGDPVALKRYETTLMSCSTIVVPLYDYDLNDLLFILKCLKLNTATGELVGEIEKPVTFILVSSVYTWANTGPKEEAFTDDDYPDRVPLAEYQKWYEMEDLVLKLNQEGSKVRAHVVCAGIPYGGREEVLAEWFRKSWLGEPCTVPTGENFDGSNIIPWIHVEDIGRLCKHLVFFADLGSGQHPYCLCVDKSTTSLQGQIKAIAEELTEPYNLEGAPFDEEWCALNLRMDTSPVMLVEGFCLDQGWMCQDGLESAPRQICDEYTKKRNIQPIKVGFLGPPKSGKSTLAKLIADHFNVVVCTNDNSSNTCRYRGFVIDGTTIDEAAQLENSIDFVILLQTSQETCIKWGSTEEEYDSWMRDTKPELEQFFIDKLDEAQKKTAAEGEEGAEGVTFEEGAEDEEGAKVVKKEERDPQDIFYLNYRGNKEESMECVRIFIEGMKRRDDTRGRPKNFGIQTEEEVTAILTEKMEADIAAAKAREEEERLAKEAAEADIVHPDTSDELLYMLNCHLADCEALNSIPIRSYLLDNVVPTVTEGLIHITQVMPSDPIDSLAEFLEKCAAN